MPFGIVIGRFETEGMVRLSKMNLDEAKTLVEAAELHLDARPYVVVHTFIRDGRALDLALTGRLRKACKRGRVWKSKSFLTALKNASYGFDPRRAQSPGGADGIFALTREHVPANTMMRKVFDRFLDHPGSGATVIASEMGTRIEELIPVRLVSHHMRLVGVLRRFEHKDVLVLIDYDDSD
jgi:hypothetical protein